MFTKINNERSIKGVCFFTIRKMIMAFIRPDSGEIIIKGKNPLDPASRLNVGYLPENPYFYDNLSAEELLKFSTQSSGLDKKTADKRIKFLLSLNCLCDKGNFYIYITSSR